MHGKAEHKAPHIATIVFEPCSLVWASVDSLVGFAGSISGFVISMDFPCILITLAYIFLCSPIYLTYILTDYRIIFHFHFPNALSLCFWSSSFTRNFCSVFAFFALFPIFCPCLIHPLSAIVCLHHLRPIQIAFVSFFC